MRRHAHAGRHRACRQCRAHRRADHDSCAKTADFRRPGLAPIQNTSHLVFPGLCLEMRQITTSTTAQ
ncbi:hypothetical protein BVI1335_1650033 [Burkholderia vietnamiensis]|nr:hypothetical protein BVI1335_1650033 [Burkholderia vietnamiensis]